MGDEGLTWDVPGIDHVKTKSRPAAAKVSNSSSVSAGTCHRSPSVKMLAITGSTKRRNPMERAKYKALSMAAEFPADSSFLRCVRGRALSLLG